MRKYERRQVGVDRYLSLLVGRHGDEAGAVDVQATVLLEAVQVKMDVVLQRLTERNLTRWMYVQ